MARAQAFDWAEIIPNIRRFVDKCCAGKHKKQYRRHAHRFAKSRIQTDGSLHGATEEITCISIEYICIQVKLMV